MSDASTGQTVECPICGEAFDPTVAGGWCTNTECGEWQYTDDESEADDETAATDDGDGDLLSEATEATATDEDTDEAAEAGDAESAAEAAEQTPTDDAGTEAATEADPATAEGDAAAGEDGASETDAEAADADETTATDHAPSTIDCPDCGTELDADANFCVECGADVREVEPAAPLTECPSCGTDVGETDSFCVECGENLDAHRNEGDAGEDDETATDSHSDDAETDAPSQTGTAAEDAVEALEAQSDDESGSDPVPDSLVLEVRGREIPVEDGDTVGREVRAALTDAGRPEDEAVRVHREHVRFVREADAFYLVDLGDNPTSLNGRTLQKGDREAVSPGDELQLSGVATVTIRAP